MRIRSYQHEDRDAENTLKGAGCPKINIQIRAGNTRVVEFYKNLGFKLDPVISMGKRLEPDSPFTAE